MSIRSWLVAALFVPSVACAHEHRLSPSGFVVSRGTSVTITAGVGEGLCSEARPYRSGRTVRFVARTDRVLGLAHVAGEEVAVWARFAPADDRGVMLAWESNFVAHRMEGAAFDAYLESDGLDGPRSLRRAARDTSAGRERYRRCSKLWLAGSERTGEAVHRATEPLGLPLELVPMTVPGSSTELRARLLFGGEPLAGALVQAWHAPLEAAVIPGPCADSDNAAPWQGRTDADGFVTVPCAAAGAWLIGAVHMVPCAGAAEADWESTWASLAFGRLEAPGRAPTSASQR